MKSSLVRFSFSLRNLGNEWIERGFAISRTGMGAAVSRIGMYSDISERRGIPLSAAASPQNRVFATG